MNGFMYDVNSLITNVKNQIGQKAMDARFAREERERRRAFEERYGRSWDDPYEDDDEEEE